MNHRLLSGDNRNQVLMLLETLRIVLIRGGLAALFFSIPGYFLAGPVIGYLHRKTGITLAAFGLPEAFLAYLTLAAGIGLLFSLPYFKFKIFWFLHRIYPSVCPREVHLFWLSSVLLFYAGACFGFFVTLPYGIAFLLGYETPTLGAVISVKKFVSFCLMVIFGFGLIFGLPVIMVLLDRIGLIDARQLAGYRRYALLAIVTASAVLTPTPDLFNLMLMAVPLYVLFEIGLLSMRFFKKKQAEKTIGVFTPPEGQQSK